MKHFFKLISLFTGLNLPLFAVASEGSQKFDLTSHWVGITALALFFIAYLVVMAEEFIHLRKSKPVVLTAGIIWALIAWYYQTHHIPHIVEEALGIIYLNTPN